jgi:HK97 family phage portal protein
MKLRDLFRFGKAAGSSRVRADSDADGVLISNLTDGELEAYLQTGGETHSGAVVSEAGAMRIAAAWRCVHILAGVCGNNPLDIYRRVDERTRLPAADHPLRHILTRRPNGWQTPAEFRKMLTAWVLLEGNGYALKITSRGRLLELWPLNSRRVQVVQNDDMSLGYTYTRKNGSQVPLQQSDIMHLRGLTLDGVRGMGVLQYAREALGLALQGEKAGAKLFKQGVLAGGALKSPNALSDQAYARLKESIEEQNAGAENAHKLLILEEGLDAANLSMTAADAQFLESRKFQRSDIYMFFGVPPFLTGDVEKTTSWGSGVEQMGTAFKQYSAQDHTTMWEETVERDLLDPVKDANVYVMLDLRGLLRGDSTGRANYYSRALGGGGNKAWMTVNEVRALEDLNPLPGGDELPEPSTNPQPLTEPAPNKGEKD